MINFKQVHIENFLSLGQVDLDLKDDSGFILVDGENHRVEDGASSNGSGKTSAFEAIIWALTGETNRGYKDVVNRYQDEGCKVKLDFDFKGHSWSVERLRSKKGSQDLHIWKDTKELEYKGLRDAEAVLNKELPELTLNFLGSTIILGQGLPQRFTNNTPAGRKAVLEELSNADYMITHIKENIKTRQEKLANELRKVDDEILSTTTRVEMSKRHLNETQASLDALKSVDIEAKKTELTNLTKKGQDIKNKYESQKLQVANDEKVYSETNMKYSQMESRYLEEKLSVEKERSRKSEEENEKFNKSLLEATEKFGPLIEAKKDLLKAIKEQLDHRKALISGGYCKYCGQKLQSVSEKELDDARKFIEENKNKPFEVEAEIDKLLTDKSLLSGRMSQAHKADLMSIDEAFDKKQDVLKEDFVQKSMSVKHQVDEMRQVLEKSKILEKELFTSLTDLRSAYQIQKAAIESYERDLNTKQQLLDTTIKEIEEYSRKLEKLVVSQSEINQRIKVVKSFETFASRDFRGILLEDIVNQLDSNLHKYAEKVYGEPLTRFYQEGNTIGIQFDGKEYEGLSGGEKQKLDVLVQLSLRDLIIQTSGIDANIVVFDEIFDALDQAGCEALLNVISDLGLTVYSITHRRELNIPYDKRYVIVKESNGIAHLEIG